MTIPSSIPEVIFFIALVLPGISYSLARRMVVGWQTPDHSMAGRLFDALFVSLVFDAVYLLLLLFFFGWTGESALEQATELVAQLPGWHLASVLIFCLLIIPAAIGYFVPAKFKRVSIENQNGKQHLRFRQINRARSTPRAWDHAAFRAYEPCFVRVRTEDGSYYGGYFESDSLISTYPFARDIFISQAWNMGEFGEFYSEVSNTRGIWVPITDGCIVEWLDSPETEERID